MSIGVLVRLCLVRHTGVRRYQVELLKVYLGGTISQHTSWDCLLPSFCALHKVLWAWTLGIGVFCGCIHWDWVPMALHFDWVWFSVVLSFCCREKFPWQGVTTTLICRNKWWDSHWGLCWFSRDPSVSSNNYDFTSNGQLSWVPNTRQSFLLVWQVLKSN